MCCSPYPGNIANSVAPTARGIGVGRQVARLLPGHRQRHEPPAKPFVDAARQAAERRVEQRLRPLAASAGVAGLGALLGRPGLGLGGLLVFLVGNPLSGAASAPELLPRPWGEIGQWLPPGAGATLLRSMAYFSGNGGFLAACALGGWALGAGRSAAGRSRDWRSSRWHRAARPAPRTDQRRCAQSGITRYL